jgi:ferric-dicitrate binding protein FerR (iron transport regulator)
VRKKEINRLLHKYLADTIVESEKQDLLDLYQSISSKSAMYPDDQERTRERILTRLKNEIHHKEKKAFFARMRWIASSAAVIAIGLAIFIFKKPVSIDQKIAKQSSFKQTIVPGKYTAVLTLGNGDRIDLDSSTKGKLAVQGSMVITKNAAGRIVYQNRTGDTNGPITYNTITTPAGGQFMVTLPDGSNVWLNAASSLRYPSRFEGKERHVELHGEAYFEIFKNKNSPFTVTAENTNIKVLGTHFNVMAYKNEPAVATTLLEGSVSLSAKNAHALLVPGQQAIAEFNSENIILREVNVEDAVAWKNGYFSFRKQNIRAAMNKIARWYNVDVEYNGNVNNKFLGGTVSRLENITELLNYIELTGIAKFKIEGRRIIVICK